MKIVTLGDSFTRGFGVNPSERWTSLLTLENTKFINKGINGDTTSGMLARFHQDVIDKSPRYVLITGGINDFISGSNCDIPQNNYMAMVHQVVHNSIIPIIGIAPGFIPQAVRPDWAAFADFDAVLEKHQQFCIWLRSLCTAFNLLYLDFYEEFEKVKATHPHEDFYLDGIHLTPSGHRHIADIALKGFRRLI